MLTCMTQEADYIDHPDDLKDLCQDLAEAPWIAIDTEFLRERTYYPQLCLIQISTPDLIAVVDPQAIKDLGPLLEVLCNEEIPKVLHAASQDLEIFFQICGKVPGPIYDTQILATLLGHGDQLGYGALVQKILGIELAKGHARTDWSRRPLDEEALRYAEDDVRYLRQIYPLLMDELKRLKRLKWAREDCAKIANPNNFIHPPELAYKRVKGAQRLKGRTLDIARALAGWRETTAQSEDKPRKWVISDDSLIAIARRAPKTRDQLEQLRGLDRRFLQRHAKAVMDLISNAPQLKVEKDSRPVSTRTTPADDAYTDALGAIVRLIGIEHEISPAALATRDQLSRYARGEDPGWQSDWRSEILGRAFDGFRDGKLQLVVENGRLGLFRD